MLRGGKEERVCFFTARFYFRRVSVSKLTWVNNLCTQAEVVANSILPQKFDVLITSYELCLREKSSLKKLSWEYIIIDEAHRIKNVDSMLSQIVRVFDSRARLLITGTPLQNNLHELWALLKCVPVPDYFSLRNR